jgi:hypothetical protein
VEFYLLKRLPEPEAEAPKTEVSAFRL